MMGGPRFLWLSPRWRKIIRDIWDNKTRTILVTLAIAVGVFAFGSMFITREVLIKNMNEGFADTNPATVTISMNPFNDSLLRTVRNFPYVEDVSARSVKQVQVWNGKGWMAMQLIAVPELSEASINSVSLEEGRFNPERREIVFERQSLPRIADTGIGDTVLIELMDDTQRELEVVGIVHDFNAVPASTIPVLTAYVSIDTLTQLGLSTNFDELQIITEPQYTTQAELEVIGDNLVELLDRYGYGVGSVSVNEPGQHWGSDMIDATVLVLIILGLLAVGLSSFLVINTITAILSQQKRQVGMMKAIGAKTGDVMGVYLIMASVFGVLALVVALPIGVLLSIGMTYALGTFLNVNASSFGVSFLLYVLEFARDVPVWIFVLQFAAAVLTPLVSAFVPVLMGTRTTVREAISDYGISNDIGASLIDRFVASIRGLPRPVLISIRNTFRRKARLLLTLMTLALAGSIFMAVLNTRVAILQEFDQVLSMFGYDVQVIFNQPQPISRLEREAPRIPGVDRVEGWGIAFGSIIRPDGVIIEEEGVEPGGPGGGPPMARSNDPNAGSSLFIFAPPLDTEFIVPTIVEGRWLQPGDTNAIVLASEVLNSEPYIKVGEEIELDFGDKTRRLEVVGIINLVGPEFGYASFDYITRLQGAAGQSFVAMLGTTEHDVDFQEKVALDAEEHFQQVGISVMQSATPTSFIGVIRSMVNFFVGFMLFMALLLGLVGGLGLASTMSLNVIERTREIGVMRAIGSSNQRMRGIFMTEGLLIGALSYVVGSILSIPISIVFLYFVGQAFFDRPIDLVVEPFGFVLWLVVVTILASVASLLPANRAAAISVREALAYE